MRRDTPLLHPAIPTETSRKKREGKSTSAAYNPQGIRRMRTSASTVSPPPSISAGASRRISSPTSGRRLSILSANMSEGDGTDESGSVERGGDISPRRARTSLVNLLMGLWVYRVIGLRVRPRRFASRKHASFSPQSCSRGIPFTLCR